MSDQHSAVPPAPGAAGTVFGANGAHGSGGAGMRDERAVRSFVESFAGLMVEGGMPRMPARVFVALLAADSGRLTAAELAADLQASPAAISGAVRYLIQQRLIGRKREPGSRRDVFEVRSEVWQDAVLGRNRLLAEWGQGLRAGRDAVGCDTQAGRRLAESVEFLEFLQAEMAGLLERWRAFRAVHPAAPAADGQPRQQSAQ